MAKPSASGDAEQEATEKTEKRPGASVSSVASCSMLPDRRPPFRPPFRQMALPNGQNVRFSREIRPFVPIVFGGRKGARAGPTARKKNC